MLYLKGQSEYIKCTKCQAVNQVSSPVVEVPGKEEEPMYYIQEDLDFGDDHTVMPVNPYISKE